MNALGAPVRFVPSSDSDEPYELHVERTREVPTRPDNWHDVFNALAWCAFPQTKRVLNHRHGEEIRRRGATGARGTVRDALSLFDEGGVIVASARETLSAEAASARQAKLLELEPGSPLNVIERVALAPDRHPLEWRQSRGPADQFRYHVEIR